VTLDESASRDDLVEARPRIEWPFTVGRAVSVAFIGPGGIGLVGIAMLASGVGADSTRTWWTFAFADPVGRLVFGALCVCLLGAGALILVAGVRRVPALRLDDDGIAALQGFRVRHVPWGDVVGFGQVHVDVRQHKSHKRLVIATKEGEPLRIFQRVTGSSLVDVRQRCIEWLEQDGRFKMQGLTELFDLGGPDPSSPRPPTGPLLEDGPRALFDAIRFDRADRGYDLEQVDRFLAQLGAKVQELQVLCRETEAHAAEVEAQLDAAGRDLALAMPPDPGPSPPPPPVSAVLGGLRFAERRDGYDMAQVDEFLHEAGLKIAELQGLHRRAEERAVAASAALTRGT